MWIVYNIPILAFGIKHLRQQGRKGKRNLSFDKRKLPLISILVPVKNEEKVIGRLLEALMRLDYPQEKKEIVIVEDGSTDKTVEICRRYIQQYPKQMKLVHKPTSNGKPSALNCGLRACYR